MLERGDITATQITESVIQRINEVDPIINAYITKSFDFALEQAERVDGWKREGKALHPLAGIPILIKDNICTKRIPTTCASKILTHFIPPYDATVIKRLKEVGAVLIGKANMDEFGMGSSNENSNFGVVRNPWNLDRTPGGSSGGPAAAVAADECIAALGSDTGGSIRQPSAMCGVVGLKPTYGRVSRFGLIAYASSLDQIGPITKDTRDASILMNVISGYDPLDSTSCNYPVPDYTKFLTGDIKNLRIGIPKEYFSGGIEKGVRDCVEKAIQLLQKLGANCSEVSLPHTEYAISAYYLIATAEASSNLSRYDGVQYGYRVDGGELVKMYQKTREEGFGKEVKRRIMLGTYALSSGYYDAYYLKAQKIRTLIKEDFDHAFRKFDVLITPTSPTTAFKFGEKIDDPLQMYLSDIFTVSVNLAGIPALSIPCGFSGGLPVGLQILASPFQEGKLIKVAYAFEKNAQKDYLSPPWLQKLI
jgi:aspartyl-tRNA(Asn)/glutamyl-tRNA(Gln) amidotransferase subunit A